MTGPQTQQVFGRGLEPCAVEAAGLLVDHQGGATFGRRCVWRARGEAGSARCADMVRKLYANDDGLSLMDAPSRLPDRMAALHLRLPRSGSFSR